MTTLISFKYRKHSKDIILMLVRWYCAFPLSYRHVEELASERGLKISHSTINRWTVHYAPQLEAQFRKDYKRAVNGSWRMDETYLKYRGKDVYLYRAVDKQGETIDFLFTEKRDKKAALRFFCKAIGQHGLPQTVTMDKSGANKAAIDRINLWLAFIFLLTGFFYQILVRQVKYLNNLVEQDHRFIKRIIRPMLGFKSIHSAQATVAGIELHHMLKKKQHANAANQSVHEQFYALAG